MGPTIIARNYAETLLSLARRHGDEATVDEFARALDDVVTILDREPRVREFLETPQIDSESKKRALRASFAGRAPDLFVRFLMVVVEKRRQTLLRAIAREYAALVDEARGRVRADITLARAADAELEREVVATLERQLGKTVIPNFQVDPELMGGVVIRVGDQVLDGSIRRRVADLRRRLLRSPLPELATASRE
jgi:F-type H+-transporting ATPase subunit delta